MPRQHANHLQGQFETPFGPMDFTLTASTHVHISAGAAHDPSPMISVNGILYYTSIHLIDRAGYWAAQYTIHMSRRESGEDSSPAAAKKATEGIIAAWTAFIGENEYLRIEAEIRHLNNEIGKVEDDIDALKEKIRTKDEEMEGLVWRERDAYEARAKYAKKGGYPKPKDWSPTGDIPEE